MSFLSRASLVVLGLLLGLGCLEVVLRTAGWAFLYVRQSTTSSTDKRANQVRILCLGESTTADLLFMGKESYPSQLERILNERSTGARFTVINGGVPATTTDLILERLRGNLEQHRPDIVVAMMGINDGDPDDPVFQISSSLRVYKLGRLLYYTWWRNLREPPVDYGPLPPNSLLVSGKVAWQRIFDGRYAEAETLLQPLLKQDKWLTAKTRGTGMMAVLNWQRGDGADAERYHLRYVERLRQLPRDKTIKNYRTLRRILAARQIQLVAVQYPGLPVDVLQTVIEHDPHVVVVDNEETFLRLMEKRGARDVYRDLFAGIFGHLTPYANELLAENVAQEILRSFDDSTAGDTRRALP